MVEAPEKIWAYPSNVTGWRNAYAGDLAIRSSTEYTRSDITERQIEELRADVKFFREQFDDQVKSREEAEADKARLSEALAEAEDVLIAIDHSGYSQSDVLATIRAALSGSGAGGWREDRLPTHEEFKTAMAVIFACNGFDLSQWTDDIWPDEGLETVAKYMRRYAPRCAYGYGRAVR